MSKKKRIQNFEGKCAGVDPRESYFLVDEECDEREIREMRNSQKKYARNGGQVRIAKEFGPDEYEKEIGHAFCITFENSRDKEY